MYQPSTSNISNNVVKRATSRNVRPPSCARPTISSLRKMNRTFSLNNVSEAGLNNPNLNNNNKNIAAINNNINNINNPNGNIILPLTKASLAMANASSSSFNSTAFVNNNNHNNSSRYSNLNGGAESPLNMLNESTKFQSKYASSTYLNDTASSNSRKIFQPQQTRTTPRRRTPRNAEEYLLANGVDDTKTFMSKGYYVGSMVNLNEYAGKSTNIPNNQSQNQNEQNTTSSSSSSNFKLGQQQQQPQSTSPNDMLNESFNSVKRRNSIHDTASVSLANLNFLNSNFSGAHNNNNNLVEEENHHQHHKLIKNNYRNKARSNTTAIVLTNHNDGNQSDPSQNGDGSTTGGSSMPGSETSSSPNPLKPSKHSLGPLMSAVSKADESLLSPSNNNSNSNSNNHTNNKYMLGGNGSGLDDYDDYEYLERNFGAEPSFNNFNSPPTNQRNNKNNDINTTTNTNVTDYYTDESSYNNEDFKNNNKNSNRNNRFTLNVQSNTNNNTNNNNVGFVNNNSNNNINNNINVIKQQQIFMQQQHQQHLQIQQQTPSPQITANGINGWDNGSVTSNNSMLSGL